MGELNAIHGKVYNAAVNNRSPSSLSNTFFHAMSFAEFGEIFHRLLEEIKHALEREHQTIAAVAPILRSGGITGLMLSVHLGIKTLLPIQCKYHSPNEQPSLIFSAFDHLPASSLRKNSVILICETNTVTGNTLHEVLPLFRQHFPEQRFWYATLAKSMSLPANYAGIEQYFFGIETEEGISEQLPMLQKNIWKGAALFPWENKQEETKEIVGEKQAIGTKSVFVPIEERPRQLVAW